MQPILEDAKVSRAGRFSDQALSQFAPLYAQLKDFLLEAGLAQKLRTIKLSSFDDPVLVEDTGKLKTFLLVLGSYRKLSAIAKRLTSLESAATRALGGDETNAQSELDKFRELYRDFTDNRGEKLAKRLAELEIDSSFNHIFDDLLALESLLGYATSDLRTKVSELDSKFKQLFHLLEVVELQYTPLVVKIANFYVSRNKASFEHVFQDGMIGLRTAVCGYNPDSGVCFATYATPWIRSATQRSARSEGLVTYPFKKQAMVWELARIESELERETGVPPVFRDVYLRYLERNKQGPEKATPKRLKEASDLCRAYKYGKSPLGLVGVDHDGEEYDTHATVSDELPPVEISGRAEILTIITSLVDSLSEADRMLVELRFGLNGKEAHSLEDIGKMYGYSRESISVFLKRIFKKMLATASERGLDLTKAFSNY